MSRILHTWPFRMHRVPVVALLAVGVLCGSFLLPAVHHLCEHHDAADSEGCPACVFAATGAVLPTTAWPAWDRTAVRVPVVAGPARTADLHLVSASPRAPPFAD